jgi:superfamily II DNA/RNA helicase
VTSSVTNPSTQRPRRNRRRSRPAGKPQHANNAPATNASGGHRPNGQRPATQHAPATRPTRPAPVAAGTPAAHDGAQSFTEFALAPSVVAALAAKGIRTPTPIQSLTMADALAGRDILGRAQTGSGKTLAFGLPMLTRLAATNAARPPKGCRGLVLLPTRELAQQVDDALRPLAQLLGLRTLVVVGGAPINRQMAELKRGVDIVIATPGRLVDLMTRRSIVLDGVSVAVLDEADHMADLGFMPAVTRILDAVPNNRQCLLFSATLDKAVDKLVARYLSRPSVHTVGQTVESMAGMEHRVFRLKHEDKIAVATEIADRRNRTLIFVRTKHGADRLARQMRTRGVEATAIHGNLNLNQRKRALAAFSSGGTPVLIATDIAARGIHVDDLDLVVHFDPPADHKTYAHRSGRTARSGASGTVVSLVEPQQAADVARMHAAADVHARTANVFPGHAALRDVTSPSSG